MKLLALLFTIALSGCAVSGSPSGDVPDSVPSAKSIVHSPLFVSCAARGFRDIAAAPGPQRAPAGCVITIQSAIARAIVQHKRHRAWRVATGERAGTVGW